MPTEAQVLNTVQFNELYGCCRCTKPGETIASGKGQTHAYPYKDGKSSGPPRTLDGFRRDAKKAYEEKKRVYGINGPSWMLYLCDIVRGTAIDYMHQILRGFLAK